MELKSIQTGCFCLSVFHCGYLKPEHPASTIGRFRSCRDPRVHFLNLLGYGADSQNVSAGYHELQSGDDYGDPTSTQLPAKWIWFSWAAVDRHTRNACQEHRVVTPPGSVLLQMFHWWTRNCTIATWTWNILIYWLIRMTEWLAHFYMLKGKGGDQSYRLQIMLSQLFHANSHRFL